MHLLKPAMNKFTLALFFLSFSLFADEVAMFGTNVFSFCFEDSSLSEESRTAMAACLADFAKPWTNVPVSFRDELSGRLSFSYGCRPDLGCANMFPASIRRNTTNEAFRIVVDRHLSNGFLDGLKRMEGKSTELSSLADFIAFLNSTNAWQATEEMAVQRFHDGVSMASSIRPPYRMTDVWTNEVTRYKYGSPTPWGVFEWPLEDETQGAFSVELPVMERTPENVGDVHPRPTTVVMSWIDGIWKFHPIPW